MAPLAAAQAEDDVLPAPCSIHDDRLRELETEQAAQRAQLVAGTEMFRAIQDSIKSLNDNVRDSMNRVETRVAEVSSDVKALTEKVNEVQVQQAGHEEQLKEAARDRAEDREAIKEADNAKKERRRFWVGVALKVGIPVFTLSAATIASKSGRSLLAEILKAIGAGG